MKHDSLHRSFHPLHWKESEQYGCSTLAVHSPDGAALFGRNFDWKECNIMLVHTIPKDGYESVATCNLDFLGFGADWKPDLTITSGLRSAGTKCQFLCF